MALVRTSRRSARSGQPFGTSPWTDGTGFTPSANSLLCIACGYQGNDIGEVDISGDCTLDLVDATTGVSLGLTITERKFAQVNGQPAGVGQWTQCLKIFTAPIGGSPAAMKYKLACAGRNIHTYGAMGVDFTGYDIGSPVGVSAAGVCDQNSYSGDAGNPGSGMDFGLTLSGAPASASHVFAALWADSGALGIAPDTGWTELFETFENWAVMQTQARTASTSTAARWNTGLNFNIEACAIEIKEAAAAGAGAPPPREQGYSSRQHMMNR